MGHPQYAWEVSMMEELVSPGEVQVSRAWEEGELAWHTGIFRVKGKVWRSMHMCTGDRDHVATHVASLPTPAPGTFQSLNK